jgi:hypothetical protein
MKAGGEVVFLQAQPAAAAAAAAAGTRIAQHKIKTVATTDVMTRDIFFGDL